MTYKTASVELQNQLHAALTIRESIKAQLYEKYGVGYKPSGGAITVASDILEVNAVEALLQCHESIKGKLEMAKVLKQGGLDAYATKLLADMCSMHAEIANTINPA